MSVAVSSHFASMFVFCAGEFIFIGKSIFELLIQNVRFVSWIFVK